MSTQILTAFAYDPLKVRLFIGTERAYGFAPDSKLTVSRNQDNIIPHMGVDGELSVALSRDRSGVMTVNLQNTSGFNKYLMNWQRQADVTGLVFLPVQLEGSQGPSISTIGWIQKQPDLEYTSEISDLSWEIGLLDAWYAPDQISSFVSSVGSFTGIF